MSNEDKSTPVDGTSNEHEAFQTPLHEAVSSNNSKLVESLLKSGVNKNRPNKEGKRPIHLAASEGYSKIVELLVKKYKAHTDVKDSEGYYPLHLAAYYGHFEAVKVLVNNGADISAVAREGGTAIEFARHNKKDGIAEFLKDSCTSQTKQPELVLR